MKTPSPTAVSQVQSGGHCAHCGHYLKRSTPITKWSPACCRRHFRDWSDTNGPGRWVCDDCDEQLRVEWNHEPAYRTVQLGADNRYLEHMA